MWRDSPRGGDFGEGFFARLARDRAGNTLAIIAAALVPILAMVGGGIDMGRSYLSQSRLQQACDAGVLAARKALGTEVAIAGDIPEHAAELGQRFFNINFRDGSYGTQDRDFTMYLEEDFAVTGEAAVILPTTIMRVFGHDEVPITVECQAQINFNDTDVMMVLDVTGSMGQTNPGDTMPRLDVLKDTVKTFHAQLDAAGQAGTRIRYGFVPYSTNVNVLPLLRDEWVVNEWAYQSRDTTVVKTQKTATRETDPVKVSGSVSETPASSYAASFSEGSGYVCASKPANQFTQSETKVGTRTETTLGPPAGTVKIETIERTRDGVGYDVRLSGTQCQIYQMTYADYVEQYERITEPTIVLEPRWQYGQYLYGVSDFRSASNGCIEERETYEIDDYENVDLSRALDLDIDLVPGSDGSFSSSGLLNSLFRFGGASGGGGEDDDDDDDGGEDDDEGGGGGPKKVQLQYDTSKWRPMYPDRIFIRRMAWDNTGAFDKKPVVTADDYISPASLGTAACPPPARKLDTMSPEDLDSYLATLTPAGNTYHDIGMIWGARLISPTGLFAAENADRSGAPTNRNLIFLTDGETAPRDISYSSYGVEPLDERRWSPDSPMSLTETIEKRFQFVCKEVRKRNITVWVVGFGTELSDVMKECAGEGHYFEAANAAELNASFGSIAKKMSELRISR